MEQLTYEIKGIKYLLMEVPMFDNDDKKTVKKAVIKYGGIVQGIGTFKKPTYFSNGFLILKVLVPEENIMDFQNVIL